MKKAELEQKLSDIDQRIGSIDDLNQKKITAEQVLSDVQKQLSEMIPKTKEATDLLSAALEIKTGAEKAIEVLNKGVEDAKEYNKLKSQIEALHGSYQELEKLSRDQLGFVSMGTLANSFAERAGNLKESAADWFDRIFNTSLILAIAVIGVAAWQVYAEKTLLEFSFLVRLPIISPVIYYLVFVHSQYSRDKRLFEEYDYKASIAASFEAYRKVIKEELYDSEGLSKKTDFILGTIRDTYSSPMKNILNQESKGEESDKTGEFNLLERTLEVLNKLKDLFLPK